MIEVSSLRKGRDKQVRNWNAVEGCSEQPDGMEMFEVGPVMYYGKKLKFFYLRMVITLATME